MLTKMGLAAYGPQKLTDFFRRFNCEIWPTEFLGVPETWKLSNSAPCHHKLVCSKILITFG